MSDDNLRDGPTPESERHGGFVEVTVVADDRSQATVKRRKSSSGLIRLYENGHITAEQFAAALKIASIIESIEKVTSIRSASLEARVDYSASAKDVLIENISSVRDEMAYSIWRAKLPMPKRMVIDMLVFDRPLAATARVYKVSWVKARCVLRDALDCWISVRDDFERLVDVDDLKAAHYRLLTFVNGNGR